MNNSESLILKDYVPSNSLNELLHTNPRLHSIVIGIIETELTKTKKTTICKRLGISDGYIYHVKSKFNDLIKSEVAKLKQLQAEPEKKGKAKQFFQEHELEFAAKIYFNAMTSTGRDSTAACKLALDAVKDEVQEPPDVLRKMQSIMYAIFYPEKAEKPAIDVDNQVISDKTEIVESS